MEGNLQSFSLHNGGLQFLLKCIYNTDGIDDNNSPNFHRELLQYFQEIKSDFLRKSRIGRHSRKIDFSFISPKRTFE